MQGQNEKGNAELFIKFSHPRIGNWRFPASEQQTLGEFRIGLELCSELFMFTNYYFEYKGSRLSELEPLGVIFTQKEPKVDITFSVFQYRTAKYHLMKVMEVIFNPQLYLFLMNSKDTTIDLQNSNLQAQPLQLPKNIGNLDIQNLKPDLSSPFLVGQIEIEKKVDLLMSLSLSGFNPAPPNERLNGDLFYIHARTLEGHDTHITASPAGFYLNQSKISSFNPNRSTIHKNTYTSLIDLFKAISERFKHNLQIFLSETKLTQAMKYKFYSLNRFQKQRWLEFSEQQHGWNQRKSIVDQHIKAELLSLKDWNQVYQLLYKSSIDFDFGPVQKSAQLFRTYSQFKIAAIEGATYLVDGKISPLNPSDEKKKHIYIYNKIFFSIANETVCDHSQQKGEDATPSSSAINTDLINMQILQNFGIPDLHVLHMIIINYRGYKVIAQCIIPGILSVDQLNCSQYGSIDDGKTIQTNPEFQKIMIQVCNKMGLQDQIMVTDAEGNRKRIAGSPDIKGILGSDKRKYILDLLRLSPRDLNYEGPQNQTCVIRPQLLKNYRKYRGNQALTKINVNIGTDIKFQKSQKHEEQLKLLKDLAAYLRKNAIDNLIDTLKNYPSQYLTNNEGVAKAFHYWGVNMRYLGQVCSHESVKNQIQIKLVLQRVIIVRAIKHFIRMAMRESNITHLGATIINILNCIFGRKNHILYMEEGTMQTEESQDKNTEKDGKKKKKKKQKQVNQPLNETDVSQIINIIKIPQSKYASMKPNEVWDEICKIANARFRYEFPKNQLDFEVFKFPFQKVATLRDVCLSVGIVLQRKNYDIFQGNQNSNATDKILPFNCKNIIQIEPKAKHMKIEPANLQERQKQNEKLIQKYQVKEALKLDESLEKQNIFICGGLNDTAVKLFTRMSRILYILGQNKSAVSQQQKNACMLESLHSQDHWLNIQTHLNLGLYYIAGNDKNRVIYYMVKGLYLMLISFGETSPDLLVTLANLARIFQMNKQYKQAIKCYKVAMKFVEQIHGKFHVKMSFCYTSLATISYEMADLKSAIEHQTQTVGILNKILPDTDTKFQDALKILKMYRDLYQKSQIHTNFMNSNLNMMNANLLRNSEPPKKIQEQKDTKKKSRKN